MEFLEHIENDISVLCRLRPGTYVLATVPNFAATGHVRHFDSEFAVRRRYESALDSLRVDSLLENERGKTYFIVEGVAVGEAYKGSAHNHER